ncbi:MAG TPA: choice-of-anchor tandem repeat GloVer-containing protein [Candidatus Baltobacteraceae bacterium]|jgi:uncharacterized repeat protein (TIGR03803 family)|nr:choice-of-anchor tandem repeat GloVer-containing protein [Candidatus Baltobacteraceae bacterium]
MMKSTALRGVYALGICATLPVLLAACGSHAAVAPEPVLPAASSPQTTSTFKLLYSFNGGTDGAKPLSRLTIGNDGALYGTTASGGSNTVCFPQHDVGCGTVFKLTPSGSAYSESVIYRFRGYDYNQSDGAYPAAGVVADSAGALYGTTEYGNQIGDGILFKLTPAASGYSESILHNFTDSPDGQHPTADLLLVNDMTLYGTTPYGGYKYGCNHFCGGCGTIFKGPTNGASETIYSFCAESNGPDGSEPRAGLFYNKGTFYGTATGGGSNGSGTIFRFDGSVSVLQNLCADKHCKDGAEPEAPLVQDDKGSLYGTTITGGHGYGIVFKLTRTRAGYREHVLHRFRGAPDGANPIGGLVIDKAGSLYGTTSIGGSDACHCGTIFKLARSQSGYSETVVHSFTGLSDGAVPKASLTIDSAGHLYGTTSAGGTRGAGAVFELIP